MSDLDGRCFIRRGNTLVPADFAAEELLASIKPGREVIVTIRKARSPKHHRFFFATLRKVVEATGMWLNENHLLDNLKIAIGHVERSINVFTRSIEEKPKSINTAAMDEIEFTAFHKLIVEKIAETTGIDPEELMNEVNESQGVKREKDLAA